MLARSRQTPLGVEFSVVVQGHRVMGVGVAEDMATVSAVVTALEQVERFMTRGRVADDGVGVGLPMVPRGESFDHPEGRLGQGRTLRGSVGIIDSGLALGGGSPAPRSSAISIVQAVGAAVHASRRGQWRCAMRSFGRSQHGRDVQGQLRRSELSGGQRQVGQQRSMMRGRR
jgi:hypothetical protein